MGVPDSSVWVAPWHPLPYPQLLGPSGSDGSGGAVRGRLGRDLSYGCSRGQVASLMALMNSPDPGPVAGPAQGRAAAFPTYFPSGFMRRGGWLSWGRPHVSWPSKPLPGRAPGPHHHTGTSPSALSWPGSQNHWVWRDGKGSWLGRPAKGSGQAVLGSRIFTANEVLGPAFLLSRFWGQGQWGCV